MRKTILFLTGLAMMASSTLVQAVSLGKNMDTINLNYRQAQQATTVNDFKQALAAMRRATEASKKEMPPKLQGLAADSEEVKDYRHGLDILINQIDKVEKQADAGPLDQAKSEMQQMLQTRKTYHKKYR